MGGRGRGNRKRTRWHILLGFGLYVSTADVFCLPGGETETGAVTWLFFSCNTDACFLLLTYFLSLLFFPRQSSAVERLPSWQKSLCMNDDGEWIKTAAAAPGVPEDAVQPTPDDLAYIVMRQVGTR